LVPRIEIAMTAVKRRRLVASTFVLDVRLVVEDLVDDKVGVKNGGPVGGMLRLGVVGEPGVKV